MLIQSIVTMAALAVGINAAALPASPAAAGKTFKFQIVDPKKGKWFLADATGAGTQDQTKALDCQLAGTANDVLTCGGKAFDKYPNFGDMFQMEASQPVASGSTGWSIDSDNKVHWNAKPKINFDIGLGSETNLWAETCPDAHGHWTGERGYAVAVWV
ncbi:uncharacterized protein SPSK_06677 [Sporothrix schenckii 1099-18]|nr:uncharacterized protein SPSK_06677 [Sporothrix schenckii 1099-18]KJR89806.1 hypothetical protein SPSK_06677 [Sporothrix schenckii 1099-18]